MNTVPILRPGSITAMTGLSSRPVFFLRLNGSPTPNLVVKGEAAGGSLPFASNSEASTSVKWGSKLMKNVNNTSVNTKIMTPAEIALFKQAAMASFARDTPQFRNVGPGGPVYNWVKMPYVAGLSDAEYYDDNNDPSQAAIKKNIAKFSDDAVWTDLGKIVAVDIFNGNNDRFDISTGRWINKGNVMFVAGGATKVIGLDTFDPNSDKSNLVRTGGFDELRALIDPGARNTFATACVKSVGNELKRGLGKGISTITLMTNGPNGPQRLTIEVAKMQDLFLPYAPNFEAGLAAGATDLKNYLQNKVRQYRGWQRATPTMAPPRIGIGRARAAAAPAQKTIPQGILDRMLYLGWNV